MREVVEVLVPVFGCLVLAFVGCVVVGALVRPRLAVGAGAADEAMVGQVSSVRELASVGGGDSSQVDGPAAATAVLPVIDGAGFVRAQEPASGDGTAGEGSGQDSASGEADGPGRSDGGVSSFVVGPDEQPTVEVLLLRLLLVREAHSDLVPFGRSEEEALEKALPSLRPDEVGPFYDAAATAVLRAARDREALQHRVPVEDIARRELAAVELAYLDRRFAGPDGVSGDA